MDTVKRNIIMSKAGGNASKNSLAYKISIPAGAIKDLGITPEDRSVILSYGDGRIVIEKDRGEEKMKKLFLESNGYNMLGFVFENGMVAFDCETIDQALNQDCSNLDGCETAEEAAVNCNTEVVPFIEEEWENVTEIVQKWALIEYRDSAGIGSHKVFNSKEEAVKYADEEWYNLVDSDKESYFKDPAPLFYVGLFNACEYEGKWLISSGESEIAKNYLEE